MAPIPPLRPLFEESVLLSESIIVDICGSVDCLRPSSVVGIARWVFPLPLAGLVVVAAGAGVVAPTDTLSSDLRRST